MAKSRLEVVTGAGVVRLAMENKVPLVPVYVFGQSVLWSQLPLPKVVASWRVAAFLGMRAGPRSG